MRLGSGEVVSWAIDQRLSFQRFALADFARLGYIPPLQLADIVAGVVGKGREAMRTWMLALTALLAQLSVVHGQDWNRPPVPPIGTGGIGLPDSRPFPGNAGAPVNTPLAPQDPAPNANCQPATPPWRVHGWLGADYLLYFPNSQPVPNIVTADAPGVAILVGGHVGYGAASGFRIDVGVWLDSADLLAGQTIFDQLIRKSETFAPAGTVFLQTNLGGVPFPVPVTNFIFQTWTQFNKVDGNTLLRLWNTNTTRFFAIVGTKVMSLEEDINMVYNAGAGPLFDEFHTRNMFYGVQLGLKMERCSDPWSFDLTAKISLGGNYTNTTILGANTINSPTQVFTNDANIGYYEKTVFSVVPEILGNLSYRVTDRLSLRIGYNFLAYSNVQRPGSQIVQNIAPGLAAPHTQPAFPDVRETFVVHGANFGATFRY